MKTTTLLTVAAVAALAGTTTAYSEVEMDSMMQEFEAFDAYEAFDSIESNLYEDDFQAEEFNQLSAEDQQEQDLHALESWNYFYERQAEEGALRGKTYGIDYSTYFGVNTIKCLRGKGHTFAIPRGYQSIGRVDPNLTANVRNARSGGMKYVDTYFFPCPTCGNAAGQVNTLANHLKKNKLNVGMIWLDIEGTQYWYKNVNTNRTFFNQLLAAAAKSGYKVGIYSSRYQWNGIFGNGFTNGGKYPLWYAHYDRVPNFNSFVKFGGFSKPAIKQYVGDVVVCGGGVDLNVY